MGFLGGLGKVLGTVGGVASFIPGPHQPFAKGAAILGGALSGAEKDKRASGLRRQALDLANARYAAGAPFRQRLAQLASAPPIQREDLSDIFADPGNPYARAIPRPSLAAQAAAPAAPPSGRVSTLRRPGLAGAADLLRERRRPVEDALI